MTVAVLEELAAAIVPGLIDAAVLAVVIGLAAIVVRWGFGARR